MAKKHRCPEEEEHADETWLVPYSDVLTLLLALFIVLFAVSKVDQQQFKQLAETFHRTFIEGGGGILSGQPALTPEMRPTPVSTGEAAGMSTQDVNTVLNAYIEANKIQELVSIVPTTSGFSVRMLGSVVFNQGSATILPAAQPILNEIARMAVNSSYYINIEGHTDDTSTPANNWILSNQRAMAVLQYMVSRDMPPDRISATGYGEYHPLLPNITDENRAINRRVEINFMTSDFFMASKPVFGEE